MSDQPKSIATSSLNIMGVELVVHNLDNGQRIIEAEGLHELLTEMAAGVPLSEAEAHALGEVFRS